MYQHVVENQILAKEQYGFRSRIVGKFNNNNNNNNNHGSTALYGLRPPLASSFRGY
jgi:hypothetical protein